MVMLWQRVSR